VSQVLRSEVRCSVQRIVDVLVSQWIYDIEVLSQWWVIFFVFPALIYFVFMIVKWMVLTLPVWLPVMLATTNFKK
jgi:hypothetical protein